MFFSEVMVNTPKINGRKVVPRKILYPITSLKFYLNNIIAKLWRWAHGGKWSKREREVRTKNKRRIRIWRV